MFKFSIVKKNKRYRAGVLKTSHGNIETPCFVPVGTAATVKALTPQMLKDIGVQIVLANTYHLMLRPGADLIQKMGGVAEFMGWCTTRRSDLVLEHSSNTFQGPTLKRKRSSTANALPTMTDSGGYQVFSLGRAQDFPGKVSKFTQPVFTTEDIVSRHSGEERSDDSRIRFWIHPEDSSRETSPAAAGSRQRRGQNDRKIKPTKIDEEGVTFYSHLDGNKYRLDSKISIAIQEKLDADLIVAFDDHESPLWDHARVKDSVERTHRWAIQSLQAAEMLRNRSSLRHIQGSTSKKAKEQLMYGVTHGAGFEDLRKESAKFIEKHFAVKLC